MQLNELFDKPSAKWKVVEDTPNTWVAEAKLKNRKQLRVTAEEEDGFWDLNFLVDDDYDKTGDGNEFEVMALVADILRGFSKARNPEKILMQASEENRSKLYERILKRELKNWHIKRVYDTNSYLFVIVAVKDGEMPDNPDYVDPSDRYMDGDEVEAY